MADGGGTTAKGSTNANRKFLSSKLIRVARIGVVIALNASLINKNDGTCQALIPQTQSFSEWDESGMQSPQSFTAKDEEFVQLDAQAGAFTSLEAKAEAQARMQAQEAFKAKIEARLNAVQATKSSIRELQKQVASQLLKHDRKVIQMSQRLEERKSQPSTKHEAERQQNNEMEMQAQTLLQLDQLQSKEDLGKESPKEKKKEEAKQVKSGAASVKAPSDPKYLKKVQLNNEKPPVKEIKPPIQRSFLQLSTQIKMDTMAEEAAETMTTTGNKQETKHGASQFEKQKSKDMSGVSLDALIMERVEAQSSAVARHQMRVQSLAQAYEHELLPKVAKVVEGAVKDVGEGATERKSANAFSWTMIDAKEYNPALEEGIGANLLQQGQTIREGMMKTGGYVGTDLDQSLNQMEDSEQIDISDQIASLHGEQNLIMTKTLLETRLSLKSLRKHRRQLRERLLCQTNCKFESWSYLNGIRLSKQCPIDCPIKQELEGTQHGKTSMDAMEAYQNQDQVKDGDSNRQLLIQTDREINKLEKLVGGASQSSAKGHSKQHTATVAHHAANLHHASKKKTRKDKKQHAAVKEQEEKKKRKHKEEEESDDDDDDDDDDSDSDSE